MGGADDGQNEDGSTAPRASSRSRGHTACPVIEQAIDRAVVRVDAGRLVQRAMAFWIAACRRVVSSSGIETGVLPSDASLSRGVRDPICARSPPGLCHQNVAVSRSDLVRPPFPGKTFEEENYLNTLTDQRWIGFWLRCLGSNKRDSPRKNLNANPLVYLALFDANWSYISQRLILPKTGPCTGICATFRAEKLRSDTGNWLCRFLSW